MTRGWSLHIELPNDTTPESALDGMHDSLTDHHAVLGYAPGTGNVSIRLTVDATTARQALDAGLKAVTRAARNAGVSTTVLGVEVVTEEELERRLAEPLIPELAGLSEVADILQVKKQRANQVVKNNGFPPPVQTLAAGSVYIADQVRRFNDGWTRTNGRPRIYP